MKLPERAMAGLLIGTAVVAAVVAVSPSTYGTPSGREPGPEAFRRVWRRDVLAPQPTRYPARGDLLLGPQDVVEGPGGHVYVLDFGDQTIKQFSPDGQLVRRFGRGRGGGPGEVMNATDFAVTPNGEVWVLDPGQGRIQVFTANGDPARVIRVTTPASRLVVHRDGSYTLLGLSEWLLYHHTVNGSLARSFGRVVPDQRTQTLAIQGEIAATPDGGVVYGPLRAGYLARFTGSGGMVYHRSTVEPRPYPRIEVLPNGGRMIARQFRDVLSTRAVGVAGNEVFALTAATGGGRARWAVDVYGLEDGAYRYSFPVPEAEPSSLYVTQRHIYLVGETTVTRWGRRR